MMKTRFCYSASEFVSVFIRAQFKCYAQVEIISRDFAFSLCDDVRRIILFGRADSAVFAGRPIVYEINTNPYLGWFSSKLRPPRRETQLLARQRIADALASIDTRETGSVHIRPSKVRRPIRWWRPGFVTPRRP